MNKITINGVTVNVPSESSVSIVNGKITINGQENDANAKGEILKVVIEGSVGTIITDRNVEVNNSTVGRVEAGNNVTCGHVNGDAHAGNNVICGNVRGRVDAGNNVICKK